MDLDIEQYKISSSRLSCWDYANPGWYYITINTRNHKDFFGEIIHGKMQLNTLGKTAEKFWKEIPVHFTNSEIDYFVIMPNHVHGIVIIVERRDVACNVFTSDAETNKMSVISPAKGSLPAIIRSYKSAVSKSAHEIGVKNFQWQPRFFDRIIRSEKELYNIRTYIQQNPFRFSIDEKEDEFVFE